ncbi:MAG: nucleotidyl transferase AbiEii/AbiGii toxin family protein [Chlorobiota bacterium]|nr:MAG: nucleotidyl transferase AbiEii/AbiGii toxin family protein [Chlorobiota bacterium]
MFVEILSVDIDDCVSFDSTDINVDPIITGGVQSGARIFIKCSLDNIKSRLQIDLGFGDVLCRDPVKLEFPVILKEFEKPGILAYRIETALAEKFEAIVALHLLNSRMKDFYDIIFIASNFRLTHGSVSESINATFRQRGTKLENSKRIFESQFKRNPEMQTQWTAFLSRKKLQFEMNFEAVVTQIESFLKPCIDEPESNAVWNPEAFRWEKL